MNGSDTDAEIGISKEIRMGWKASLMWDDGSPCNGGVWRADTPSNRELLLWAVQQGRALFGATSYWLEERDAPERSSSSPLEPVNAPAPHGWRDNRRSSSA